MPRRRDYVTVGDRSHALTIHAPAGTLAPTDSTVERGVPAAILGWPVASQPREFLQLGGVQSQTHYTVNVSYRTDIQPTFVLVEECCTQRRFQIVAIIPTDRRDGLDITCVTSG